MLKINILKEYKSIKPCQFELPDFSVLTGLNGSGKTHLLEAISNNLLSQIYHNDKLIETIVYIPFNGLNPKVQENCNPLSITNFVKNFYREYSKVIKFLPSNSINPKQFLLQRLNDKIGAEKFLERIEIPFNEVDENYLMEIFDVSMMSNNDFFTGQFALIFKNYHKLLEENRQNEYYREKGYDVYKEILTDEEFNEKYGIPPWDFVNEILESINVPYRVNSPLGSRMESNFEFKLNSIEGDYSISSQDLSTGEKVLMSLALAIYNSNGNQKPQLLLIDEPDAALHPSMSKKMVEVLKNKIVELAKIPVIIASHSPTTIISCDGNSIYKMQRGNSIPEKTSVQDAIEILSSDIPFLKISNDNRRQVFVENKNDVKYYEIITNILNRISPIVAEPIYIPARTSNGSNCSDVINIVNSLFSNGNEQVYGIIDWDTTNVSNQRIIVLGENERYSIENYILDPLLMGLFFIREAKIPPAEIGLENFNCFADLQNINKTDCQIIIDYVLTKLNLKTENITTYSTLDNIELEISGEFNNLQGHNLEELYKKNFPFLNSYHQEEKLKIDVLNKVFNDFPKLIPKSIFETIDKIK